MNITFLGNANSLHLREWAGYLSHELGHRVTVLTIPRLATPYDDGVEVVQLGSSLHETKLTWPLLVPRLRAEVLKRRTDVHIAYRNVIFGIISALSGLRPLVLAAQGGDLAWPPGNRAGHACVRFAVRRADLLNAWSDNIAREMVRHGADPARIVVLSRGIDLRLFPGIAPRPERPPRLVMTRSLLPSYNVKQLVAAMPFVLAAVPDAVCDIAGDGPLRPALEAQARELGVAAHVRFLGRQTRDQVVRLLEEAHVYVSTTITDGLPLSHFEAMAAGAVPVCTNIAANRLWIEDGWNGALAPVGNAATLGRRIAAVLRDHGLRQRAQRENRALVERVHDRRRNLPRMVEGWTRLVGGSVQAAHEAARDRVTERERGAAVGHRRQAGEQRDARGGERQRV